MKRRSMPTRTPVAMRNTHDLPRWMRYRGWLWSSMAMILFTIGVCTPRHMEPLPGDSIYQITAPFTDDDGRTVSLSDFRGRKVALAMIYTQCVYVCPRLVADMKRLQKALAERSGPDVHFLAISFDPQRDSPAALRRYRKRLQLDRHWSLLSAPDPDVRELAAALGIAYTKLESGDFSHSIAITILDENGVILHRQEGNTTDMSVMLERLR